MDRVELHLREALAKAKARRTAEIETHQQIVDGWSRDVMALGELITQHYQRYGPDAGAARLGIALTDECMHCHEQIGRVDADTPWTHHSPEGPAACWPESRVSPMAAPMTELPALPGLPGVHDCSVCRQPMPGAHAPHCPAGMEEKRALLEARASNGASGG